MLGYLVSRVDSFPVCTVPLLSNDEIYAAIQTNAFHDFTIGIIVRGIFDFFSRSAVLPLFVPLSKWLRSVVSVVTLLLLLPDLFVTLWRLKCAKLPSLL